jgi:hypothetical protein
MKNILKTAAVVRRRMANRPQNRILAETPDARGHRISSAARELQAWRWT